MVSYNPPFIKGNYNSPFSKEGQRGIENYYTFDGDKDKCSNYGGGDTNQLC
jgi:hypothetical protein